MAADSTRSELLQTFRNKASFPVLTCAMDETTEEATNDVVCFWQNIAVAEETYFKPL